MKVVIIGPRTKLEPLEFTFTPSTDPDGKTAAIEKCQKAIDEADEVWVFTEGMGEDTLKDLKYAETQLYFAKKIIRTIGPTMTLQKKTTIYKNDGLHYFHLSGAYMRNEFRKILPRKIEEHNKNATREEKEALLTILEYGFDKTSFAEAKEWILAKAKLNITFRRIAKHAQDRAEFNYAEGKINALHEFWSHFGFPEEEFPEWSEDV